MGRFAWGCVGISVLVAGVWWITIGNFPEHILGKTIGLIILSNIVWTLAKWLDELRNDIAETKKQVTFIKNKIEEEHEKTLSEAIAENDRLWMERIRLNSEEVAS